MNLETIDIIRIALSFLVGGAFVVTMTALAEKFGGMVGGIITGLPCPVVVSFFFQAITMGEEVVAHEVIPASLLALGAFGCFVVAYIYALRFGILAAAVGATLVWFALAVVISYVEVLTATLLASVLGCLFIASVAKILLHIERTVDPEGMKEKPALKLSDFLVRFLTGGFFISVSVLAGYIWGPKWGGILSNYPAMATSSLLILSISMGRPYARVFARSYFSSAIVGVFIYSLGVHVTYPLIGAWWGTLVAYIPPVISAYLLYVWNKSQQSKLQEASL